MSIDKAALDRYITGNYGEDQHNHQGDQLCDICGNYLWWNSEESYWECETCGACWDEDMMLIEFEEEDAIEFILEEKV